MVIAHRIYHHIKLIHSRSWSRSRRLRGSVTIVVVDGFHSIGSQAVEVHPDKKLKISSVSTVDPKNFDLPCLADEKSLAQMRDNIARRRVKEITVDLDLVKKLRDQCVADGWRDTIMNERFLDECLKLPNTCHPAILETKCSSDDIDDRAPAIDVDSPKEFHEIAETSGWFRRSNIGALVGGRSYFLMGALAQLESALCQYTIRFLAKRFQLISVPDILRPDVIEACTGTTFVKSVRPQLYALDRRHYRGAACLSPTSEMALAALYADRIVRKSELPIRVCALSRCFRAETSRLKEESGIFRVHQFNKVEMFGLTSNESGTGAESDELLAEFVSIQRELYESLGLRFKVVDMPPAELGAAAYRKFDIEAWMPGRRRYGEVSSASNCTDYQSRRLNIRYREQAEHRLVHTVNGTACAVPRIIIALLEMNQRDDGSVRVPDVLRGYFGADIMPPYPGAQSAGLKILRRADGSR